MSKDILVLGLEGDTLRGIHLAESGDGAVRFAVESWPLGRMDGGGSAAEGDNQEVEGNARNEESAAAADERNVIEGGAGLESALIEASKKFNSKEFVFSVPLSRLLVRVLHIPIDKRDELELEISDALEKISPFQDEVLSPSYEIVAESEDELVVIAAAFPQATADELGMALEGAKVRITRTDATALGWLRSNWSEITKKRNARRRLVLMNPDDGWDVVVLDNDVVQMLRAVRATAGVRELSRELMLSLMELEGQSGGSCAIDDVVVCSAGGVDSAVINELGLFGEVRTVLIDDEFGGVEGVARRSVEGSTFDVTPLDWSVAREETRFRKKMFTGLGIAFSVWALIMLVFLGVPFVYGRMMNHEKSLSKAHRRAHAEVKEMRDRVKLIQRYSDHSKGALEMLRRISDALPEGVTLTAFQYRNGIDLRVKGEALERDVVYEFKDAFEAMREEGLFTEVTMTGPGASRGMQRFEIAGSFELKEDE